MRLSVLIVLVISLSVILCKIVITWILAVRFIWKVSVILPGKRIEEWNALAGHARYVFEGGPRVIGSFRAERAVVSS